MNGSGKAGNGRGNNRKRPFRRWDRESNAWQEKEQIAQGSDISKTENSHRNRNFHKASNGGQRVHSRGLNTENQNRQSRGNPSKKSSQIPLPEKASSFSERPKWAPPIMNTEPLPVPVCPWCNKPIRDISTAMADKDTGVPVHFDCVTARIAVGENLEQGEMIVYIGGGRFGIISLGRTQDHIQPAGSDSLNWNHDFKIKRVIEWESKDKRAVWRSAISDHYSVT